MNETGIPAKNYNDPELNAAENIAPPLLAGHIGP